jgi:uncharacterized damage-inducible protein DinB
LIDPWYVRTMARYNAWQNAQLTPVLEAMPHEELVRDRGAFFGSILATANHLLWGDTIWMSRFDPGVEKPAAGIPESVDLHPTIGAWSAARFQMDGRIRTWAQRLRAIDLKGDLAWYSGALKRDMRQPVALCIAHMFNHQTHHRGQIHAMLTAAGVQAPVSDLAAMPEEA